MTKIWKWFEGRQESCVYFKFPLWCFKILNLGFDSYILKYEPGILPAHKDEIKEAEHYRMNITLKGNNTFICEKTIFKNNFVSIFRPDLYLHCLIIATKTYKLSFGLVIFNK